MTPNEKAVGSRLFLWIGAYEYEQGYSYTIWRLYHILPENGMLSAVFKGIIYPLRK